MLDSAERVRSLVGCITTPLAFPQFWCSHTPFLLPSKKRNWRLLRPRAGVLEEGRAEAAHREQGLSGASAADREQGQSGASTAAGWAVGSASVEGAQALSLSLRALSQRE